MDVNSVCVPRTPGEAVGGLCKLSHKDGRQVIKLILFKITFLAPS